ncbi:UDP-N-acetylmuramate--alanine ligase [Methanobrevibacter olleyae]|uniref:UDP-N-acetylmuramate--alanine ligase n=2 Tax=Methanobrevibacter olleyae TaxID=294671 RepID=A0A1I4J183_METOL|nr:UDP-N-acetylmuramate--alanine ligase [Methanobrevibacter olleyae]
MSDEELDSLDLDNKTFGVIGVCGVVGNLVARILMDRGFTVVGTDISSKEDCRFYSSFEDYDIEIFFGGHPEEFFKKIDFIVPPPSMSENAKVLDLALKKGIKIIELGDIFKLFKPEKPVICISGTNGKTTTTTLLKHIAYSAGIKPCEHNLKGMQGNNEFIPSLQTRLNGDLAILETGTDGTSGGLKSIIDLTHANFGILTNITVDHLQNPHENDEEDFITRSFLEYAKVKGELLKGIGENNGTLIYNSDDPTIVGLFKEIDFKGNAISFGIEDELSRVGTKPCWCGRDIEINELISGCGSFECECGIKYEKPMYLAKNISIKDRTFTLESPEGESEFTISLDGLHNVYNAVGSIIAARRFLKLSDEEIQKGLLSFKGAVGRMDIVAEVDGKPIMVDYAHNPAGVETILKEIRKIYGDTTVVITITSESGHEGDIGILEKALDNVKYIVPASHDSRLVADELLKSAKEASADFDYETLKNTFVFTDISLKQASNFTLGANTEQVIEGVKAALKTDSNIIIILGEAGFKFRSAIINYCREL